MKVVEASRFRYRKDVARLPKRNQKSGPLLRIELSSLCRANADNLCIVTTWPYASPEGGWNKMLCPLLPSQRRQPIRRDALATLLPRYLPMQIHFHPRLVLEHLRQTASSTMRSGLTITSGQCKLQLIREHIRIHAYRGIRYYKPPLALKTRGHYHKLLGVSHIAQRLWFFWKISQCEKHSVSVRVDTTIVLLIYKALCGSSAP